MKQNESFIVGTVVGIAAVFAVVKSGVLRRFSTIAKLDRAEKEVRSKVRGRLLSFPREVGTA
jgi:hypothetical protein